MKYVFSFPVFPLFESRKNNQTDILKFRGTFYQNKSVELCQMLYNKAFYEIPSNFNSNEDRYEKRGRAKISSSDFERRSEIEHFWTWMLKLLRCLCFPHMCKRLSYGSKSQC